MIDFSTININRIVMHEIKAKTRLTSYASAVFSEALYEADEAVKETIKKRLIDAAGKRSRAFELEIEKVETGSFCDLCKNIKNQSDEDFIQTTKEIAELLATSQKKLSIPGGYIIIMDCSNILENKGIYIVIKAELHQALRKDEGAISVLNEVFLSPSQKLYKIGVLYEKSTTETEYNLRFGCFIFDEQFRMDEGEPATYFYKDFLGFKVGGNSKIQSQKFYNKASQFIKENVNSYECQNQLLSELRHLYLNRDETINPNDFALKFNNDNLIDKFDREILSEFPAAFIKDTALVSAQLQRQKITFPKRIQLLGPNDDFNNSVSIITTQNELNTLSSDEEYTIIKILGKPYQHE